MAWRCYVVIFVKIGKQHRSKSPILKICARAARNRNRAKHFYITYNTPHKICFQMSGRSVLCDLWFSQTLRHKNGISIYMSIYIYIYIYIHLKKCSGKCKFQGNISQLVSMHLIWNFEGSLVEHQLCYKQNFKCLAVQEPNFREPKFRQNRPLTGFCMYIGPASVFFSLFGFEFSVM